MARPSPQTDRVVSLVELLTSHPDQPLTLAEVTRRLGVNKSTCFSMLSSLTRAGWLLRDPYRKTYRIGPALVAVGRTAAAGFPALDFAHRAMVDLSLELGVNCVALGGGRDHVTVLDQVRDLRAGSPPLRVGTAIPLRPPFGTTIVAWAEEDTVEAWLAHVPTDTRAHFRAALEITRRRGYTVEISTTPEARLREMLAGIDPDLALPDLLERLAGELAQQAGYLALDLQPDHDYVVTSLNAPVFDHDGRVTLVLALMGFPGPRTGLEIEAIAHRLLAATGELTTALTPSKSPEVRHWHQKPAR